MTYRLALKVEGPNPLYWQTLEQLIGRADIPTSPDAAYVPHGEIVKTLSGQSFARGFAMATWHWNALKDEQRAILKEFCPGISAEVYIETTTNELDLYGEREFIQALAIMHWPPADEDLQAGAVLGLDISFTHLVEVV